jgi:acetyl-CoA synthetase
MRSTYARSEDEPPSLGDTSTLADPAVINNLLQNRQIRAATKV